MKILILKVQTIGDTLLISPLISNLKKHYDNSIIDVMINEGTRDMLELNPNVGNIFEYKRESHRGLTNLQRFIKNINFLMSIRQAKYDLVIDLDEGDRGAIVSFVSGARVKIGSDKVKSKIIKNTYTNFLPKRLKKHTVDVNLDPLRILKIPIKNKKVEVYWSKEDDRIVDIELSRFNAFIHIHPFSKGWFKDVDINTIAKVIDYCECEMGLSVVITSAPISRELDKVSSILELCNAKPINMSGRLTLRQTAALNKRAKLFIGVDTAIMHIAAVNNTPVLAFFGPTSPDTWGPWDNDLGQVDYHRGGGVQINGKHRIISDTKSCMPCNDEGCDNSQISNCLMELDINIIKQNIKDMLA